MFKTAKFQKYTPWLIPLFLFLFSFILRTIKSNAFSLWSDGFITSRWTNLAHLIGYHQFDNNAPLPPVLNLLFKQAFDGSFFAQRFPHILAVSLAVVVFYQMMERFLKNRRWAFVFSLIPATGYMFLYYSHEIRPYSYLLLFTLVSLFYGYQVIVEEDKSPWKILFLILSFVALPLTHYISWFHYLALSFAFVIVILLFGKSKLKNIIKLIALNLFVLLTYIPWADSIYSYITQNLAMRENPLAIHRFTQRVFWEMIHKFAGAEGLWTQFLFAIFVFSVVYLVLRLLKRSIKREKIESFDKFSLISILYWIIFLILLLPARYAEDIFFWRHYMFLVWPFYTLIFYGLYHIAKTIVNPNTFPLLSLFARTSVALVLGFFLISNLVNTAAYLLAPDRFFHWPAIIDFVEPMILSGEKKKIYTDNPGDLRSYLETQMDPQRADRIWSAVEVVKRKELQELAKCCGKDSVLIRISITTEKPPPLLEGVDNMKTIGRSPYLDLLMNRGAAPFSGWYELHIVYY